MMRIKRRISDNPICTKDEFIRYYSTYSKDSLDKCMKVIIKEFDLICEQISRNEDILLPNCRLYDVIYIDSQMSELIGHKGYDTPGGYDNYDYSYKMGTIWSDFERCFDIEIRPRKGIVLKFKQEYNMLNRKEKIKKFFKKQFCGQIKRGKGKMYHKGVYTPQKFLYYYSNVPVDDLSEELYSSFRVLKKSIENNKYNVYGQEEIFYVIKEIQKVLSSYGNYNLIGNPNYIWKDFEKCFDVKIRPYD